MNNSDKDIILGIKQGNKDVFRTIYNIYYQRMKVYAEGYIDNPDTAEDIVQDLIFHLWEKKDEIEITSSLSAYLYRAIHNRCIHYLRHKAVASRYHERHLLKIKEAEIMNHDGFDFSFKEIEEIKERILSTLSPKTKKIFQLSRNEDKNNKEIAFDLNLGIKSVEYHITKALKTFQLALKDYILGISILISCL